MLKPGGEVATQFNPAWLRQAVLDVDPSTLPRATENGSKNSKTKRTAEKPDAKSAVAANDRNFIQRIGSDGQSEEQAALYVASKTFNEDVRTFAAQMGRDHGKANQQLREIAVNYGIEVPPDPEGLLRVKLDRLRQMAGPQMDHAFLQDFAVQGQQDAIALFELQAKHGQGQELKEFAAKRLPTLRDSYSEAKGLQQKYAPKTAVLSM
jgi:putative membrane protein